MLGRIVGLTVDRLTDHASTAAMASVAKENREEMVAMEVWEGMDVTFVVY